MHVYQTLLVFILGVLVGMLLLTASSPIGFCHPRAENPKPLMRGGGGGTGDVIYSIDGKRATKAEVEKLEADLRKRGVLQ